jgi:tetraacyldisaccharide 4'-kinase
MAPFALLYGIGVTVRNMAYRYGILKEINFNIPIISIGNLTMGGTGKTPHIEYFIQWLTQYINLAVLSRGYKRKTKGFLKVMAQNNADQVGDEPLQYIRKFPESSIYVSESRVLGIPRIISLNPEAQLILLDDAFQHRAVKPGINILLTEYSRLFTADFLIPMGRLREWRNAYKRADIILVTKCPRPLTTVEKNNIQQGIKLLENQRIFFTTYHYKPLYHLLYPQLEINLQANMHALVICAIANTDFLLDYLNSQVSSVKILEYEDHHDFTSHEIAQLKSQFEAMEVENKIIITTEKDAMRLEKHLHYLRNEQIPVFVLPAFVSFLGDEHQFQEIIKDYLLKFKF